MNKDKDCIKCKKNYKETLKLSCNHSLCQKCLCKTLLKKHLMEIPDKDSINFVCKCKKPSDLTLAKISECLKKKRRSRNNKMSKTWRKSDKILQRMQYIFM